MVGGVMVGGVMVGGVMVGGVIRHSFHSSHIQFDPETV